MRPQDVAILLKLIAMGNEQPQVARLSNSLFISMSEVSESLSRSRTANLVDYNKKKVNRQNLLEFLEHGVQYVFPQSPGAMVRGIPTAHSHTFMKEKIASQVDYVWPDAMGEVVGAQIEPLYSRQVDSVKEDALFYKLLALVDVLRVGKPREIKLAVAELEKIVCHE